MKYVTKALMATAVAVAVAVVYQWGHMDGVNGTSSGPVESARASSVTAPSFDVYYPGTETLAPDFFS